jgi:2-(1,2-epoxy-1,2-dihydrophenyl)acetyl-CoA isomerase
MPEQDPTPPATAEPSAAPVLLDLNGGVATVTFNRADAMNALDTPTKELLLSTLQQVADDPAVRVVVLTGTGRAFCVGQDLREHIGLLESRDEALWQTVPQHYNPIVELIATMNKPVIAALNGVAAGAGAAFAFAADLRILSDTAGYNLAFAGIALSCDSGSSWTLPRLVGTARAKELLLMPRTVRAEEALAIGLATRVVPAAELTDVIAEVAGTLASGPTLAYGSIRRAVAYSAGHTLTESLAQEGEFMSLTGASEDHAAAVSAFLSKETPVYTGR